MASIAAVKGRLFLLKCDFSGVSPTSYLTVSGLRATQIKIAGNQVDISNKSGNTWQELLSDAGLRKVAITASGIYDDTLGTALMQIEDASLKNTPINAEIVFGNSPAGVIYAGVWLISDFTLDGTHMDAMTFSLTLESTGIITRATA